jgi:hypothetical protein
VGLSTQAGPALLHYLAWGSAIGAVTGALAGVTIVTAMAKSDGRPA